MSRKTKPVFIRQLRRADVDADVLAVIDQESKGVRHWFGRGIVTGTYYAFPLVGRRPERRHIKSAENHEILHLPTVGGMH
jgi:hypothetical protein